MTAPVLVLDRRTVAGLLKPADYLAAVEKGFRAFAKGEAESPPALAFN
jgi:ornithine cyclodeaminase/alanine dehydrogenase-like protein (mu-crystallin family)